MRGNVRRLKSSDKLKKQRVSKLKRKLGEKPQRKSGCALKRKRGNGRRRKRHSSAPLKRPHVCVLKMSNGSAKSVRVSRRRRRSVSARRVSRENEKRLRVVRRVSRRSNRRHLILTQRSQCGRAPSRSRLRRAQRGTKSRRLSGSRDGDLQGRANRLRGSTRRSIVPGLRWMATRRRKRASRRC